MVSIRVAQREIEIEASRVLPPVLHFLRCVLPRLIRTRPASLLAGRTKEVGTEMLTLGTKNIIAACGPSRNRGVRARAARRG